MKQLKRISFSGLYSMLLSSAVIAVLFIVCGIAASKDGIGPAIAVAIILMVLAVILFVMWVVAFVTYSNAKRVLTNISGFDEERFEREIEKAPKMKNVLLSSDAICFVTDASFVDVIPLVDVIWAFAGTNNAIYVYTKEKQMYTVRPVIKVKKKERKNVNFEQYVKYILRLIARKQKYVRIGYDINIEESFKKDFASFLKIGQNIETIDSVSLEQLYIEQDYYTKDFVK